MIAVGVSSDQRPTSFVPAGQSAARLGVVANNISIIAATPFPLHTDLLSLSPAAMMTLRITDLIYSAGRISGLIMVGFIFSISFLSPSPASRIH